MKYFLCTLLFWYISMQAVFSQEYGYTRYDSKDGLASSTVYCMVQDKEGFMWFGTETGLNRFDGTHFRSFTQEDGLPDNEVIQLFADSKGRIWISPFKKTICYYYKGKIYNRENDSLLKQIKINSNVLRFAEDEQGNMLLMELNQLHLVTANNEVHSMNLIEGERISGLAAIGHHPAGGFWVMDSNKLFQYKDRLFTLKKTPDVDVPHFSSVFLSDKITAWRNTASVSVITSLLTNKSIQIRTENRQSNFSVIDEEHVGVCTPTGAIVYSLNGVDSARHFLKGVRVSSITKDNEDNIWFSTLGQGVYRLNSAYVLNSTFRDYNTPHQTFAFCRYGNSILVGNDMNIIYKLDPLSGRPAKEKIKLANFFLDPVTSIYVNAENKVIYGAGQGIFLLSPQYKITRSIENIYVKGFYPYKEGELLVATNLSVIRVDPVSCTIKGTIWPERATAVFADKDTIYIGTLNGLYCLLPDKSVQYWGDKFPAFKNRIAGITKDSNNVLWIATFGAGMIAYKNNRIVATVDQQRGLTSNICRTFYLHDNTLWVGTNKGLNKINLNDTTYPVKNYTTGDGLVSDIINVLYIDKSKVFIGTPEGVTYFDEAKIASQSRCDLRFLDISIGGRTYNPAEAPTLIPNKKSNIQFNYVGISYKSAGDIRYRYRLLGLDSAWHETKETILNYPTLPSGEYELQLQAINKFGIYSKILTTRFTIDKLLYERTWFRVLIGLLFLAVTGLLVYLIIQRIRSREQEKTTTNKRISELEQLSRKAQMNPHFIFNSLNSIQQYVMDADITGANKFIAGFSRLIRQTLEFSSKPEISLEEELDYLTNYLELEKTRLDDSFAWSVLIDKSVNPAEYYIPPMILQPFVENSVRHGLRFRRDKNGIVTIAVYRDADHLVCVLEDNGIGRKAAMKYKSISPINYQSKGLSLTADRIAMFNKEHDQKISMFIDDLEDAEQNALGTRVTIRFPVM